MSYYQPNAKNSLFKLEIDTKCIVYLFNLAKIEFYRVKQNSIATIWPQYGKWKISGKLVAKKWHRHDILLTKKAR